LGRFSLALSSFFGLLFHGALPAEVITTLGLTKAAPAAPPPPPAPVVNTSDGALQMLSILQRDSRLIDFLMEDISAYADDQVGAAVRSLHEQCRQALGRYVTLVPVIDGVEGSYTRSSAPQLANASAVKFLGNVPAKGRPEGGVLRHKGWRASKVELPPAGRSQDVSIVAPAEIEVE
jgi:hypothetical protein